jgi:hypothetical protein
MGYGSMEAVIKEYAPRCDAVYFHEAVKPDELYEHTCSADCGVISMANTCANHNFALPNKLFKYLISHIPTFSTPLQEVKRLITEKSLGYVVGIEEAETLTTLANNTPLAELRSFKLTLEASSREFCWERQEIVLLEAYDSLFE